MRVEIGIIYDHCTPHQRKATITDGVQLTGIRGRKVDAHASGSCREEKDEVVRVRGIVRVHSFLSFGLLQISIES